MRILQVVHGYPPESLGGTEIYTETLAESLSQRHEVTVLHRSTDPNRPDHDLRESRRANVRVFSLNNLHRTYSGFEAYRDPTASAVAARAIEATRPDVIHVGHLNGLSTGLVFEARRRGVPVVLTLHDFFTVCPLGQLLNLKLEVCPGPSPKRCLGCVGEQVAVRNTSLPTASHRLPGARVLGRLVSSFSGVGSQRIAHRLEEMREVLRAADVLISPSRFLRDRMTALGVSGIEFLEYGHELRSPVHRAKDPHGRIRIGFLGTAIPSKGVHVLAEAFRLLDDRRAVLRIHGAFVPYHGDTSYEARIRSLLGKDAADVLRGPFPPEALSEVLGDIDILVVPSIWEENCPFVMLEGFLARMPLVVSDHGGLKEWVRDGVDGLRFRPGDSKDLARVLRRLVDDDNLRQTLGTNPPRVPTMEEHATALEGHYEQAQERFQHRPGRVGVVVLDKGSPETTARAVESALDPILKPRIVVVQNGPGQLPKCPPTVEVHSLPENLGYAAGMNAGIKRLKAIGCDRVLLLNNDATLEPGALRRLAEALEDQNLAATGLVVLRDRDGRVESRGARVDARWGRAKLLGNAEIPEPREGLVEAEALSGAAWMLSIAALDRVGELDEEYFHSFEETDWCLRARRSGFRLAVVLGARAHHLGAHTIGNKAPERLYYAARNHLRAFSRQAPLRGLPGWLRTTCIVALNLGHALSQREVPPLAGVRAVLRGVSDYRAQRFGPLPSPESG